jgi:hypothetical protein
MESMAPTSGGKSIKFLVFLAFLQIKLKYLRPISLRFRFLLLRSAERFALIQQVRYVPTLYNIS